MNLRIKGYLSLWVCSALIFCSMCKKKQKWEGKIEKENGHIIVRNPIKPIYENNIININKVLSVRSEKANENLIISVMGMVRIDSEENIYILDSKSCKVIVFDSKGNLVNTFGKKGQGNFLKKFSFEFLELTFFLMILY